MYGKKRIVINKRNQIILAGEKSWIPIGIAIKHTNPTKVVAKFLEPIHKFSSKLTDDNSILLSVDTVNDVKKEIKRLYEIN
jgi:hypothetical protein